MFESLGYDGKPEVSARRFLSLPLAAAAQVGVASVYAIYSLFNVEALPPPTAWIAPFPVIPISLQGGGRPKAPNESPRARRGKDAPMVAPNTKGLVPPERQPEAALGGTTDFARGGPGIPGLEGIPPIGDFGPQPTSPIDIRPPILNVWEVTPPKLVRQVTPAYPPAALAMGLRGRVTLQVVVDENGRVSEVKVLGRTNPIFDGAAMDAVRQWQYTRPIARSGQAVACYMTVVVSFETR